MKTINELLFRLCENDDPKAVLLLLDACGETIADERKGESKNSVLHVLAKKESKGKKWGEVGRRLVEKGFDSWARNAKGESPFDMATKAGNTTAFAWIEKTQAVSDQLGLWTSEAYFLDSLVEDRVDDISKCLAAGVDPNKYLKDGRQALFFIESTEAAEILLANGADPFLPDATQKTPFEFLAFEMGGEMYTSLNVRKELLALLGRGSNVSIKWGILKSVLDKVWISEKDFSFIWTAMGLDKSAPSQKDEMLFSLLPAKNGMSHLVSLSNHVDSFSAAVDMKRLFSVIDEQKILSGSEVGRFVETLKKLTDVLNREKLITEFKRYLLEMDFAKTNIMQLFSKFGWLSESGCILSDEVLQSLVQGYWSAKKKTDYGSNFVFMLRKGLKDDDVSYLTPETRGDVLALLTFHAFESGSVEKWVFKAFIKDAKMSDAAKKNLPIRTAESLENEAACFCFGEMEAAGV